MFQKKIGKLFAFLYNSGKLFYKENVHEVQQIFFKYERKKCNEGNQIHDFLSSSGSGTVINYRYGYGSDFLTS